MIYQVLAIIFSLLILAAMGAVFGYIYLLSFKNESQIKWMILLNSLRLRLDKLPRLVEVLRSLNVYDQDLCAILINKRAEAWPILQCANKKVMLEMEVSRTLREILKKGDTNEKLKKDLEYLAFKKELVDAATEVESNLSDYNQKVRDFNAKLKLPLVNFIATLMKFKRLNIFEFEA